MKRDGGGLLVSGSSRSGTQGSWLPGPRPSLGSWWPLAGCLPLQLTCAPLSMAFCERNHQTAVLVPGLALFCWWDLGWVVSLQEKEEVRLGLSRLFSPAVSSLSPSVLIPPLLSSSSSAGASGALG